MRNFTVTTEGQNKLGLREVCERYVNEQWLADHMTPEQAEESVLEQFKRRSLRNWNCWKLNAGMETRPKVIQMW